jgi:hypothetical protein
LRRPTRPKAIEDKENEIRYNDMGTFFGALKKNDSDDERVRPTWDEVDRRIGCWSRPSEGGVIGVSGVDDADESTCRTSQTGTGR